MACRQLMAPVERRNAKTLYGLAMVSKAKSITDPSRTVRTQAAREIPNFELNALPKTDAGSSVPARSGTGNPGEGLMVNVAAAVAAGCGGSHSAVATAGSAGISCALTGGRVAGAASAGTA